MALQIPIGALVDHVPAKRLLAAVAVAAISGSALLLALWPIFSVVLGAKLLHAIASCLAGPVLAAISLGLVGHTLLGSRLGRNARFLSLGNAIAAGLMGGVAHYYSNQAIFFLTAAFGVPALVALAQIRSADIDPELARGGARKRESGAWSDALAGLASNRPLLIFASAIVLFQLSNAAMLPIMAGSLTTRAPEWATVVIAICILAPQFVVAVIAPWVGRTAQSWGRRPLLMLCFVPLCVRGAVFAASNDPSVIVAAQLLDGISAATLGVLVPLVIADTTRGTGHFNFAQGVVGVAVGIGASLGTTIAGYVADMFGDAVVFLFLGSCRSDRSLAGACTHARNAGSAGRHVLSCCRTGLICRPLLTAPNRPPGTSPGHRRVDTPHSRTASEVQINFIGDRRPGRREKKKTAR